MVKLAAPVSVDDQEITLDEPLNGPYKLPYRIVIDNEAMLVTGIHETTCRRSGIAARGPISLGRSREHRQLGARVLRAGLLDEGLTLDVLRIN
jgi:hypothetical protein